MGIASRRRSARAAAHSIRATRAQATAITPAITSASSSATAAAIATPARNRTSSRTRGTPGRRRTGAPIEATQAYEGAGAGLAASSLQPGSAAGRPGPPSRRTSACRASIRSASSRTTSVNAASGSPAVRRLLGGGHAAGPSSLHRLDRLTRLCVDPRPTFLQRFVDRLPARRASGTGSASGSRCAASLRRSSSAGSSAGLSVTAGGSAPSVADPRRLESSLPRAAMPTTPASQASARFTERWYRDRRRTRWWPARSSGSYPCRILRAGVSYRMRRFLPLHVRAIPSSYLPVRPPKTEGRRKGNP